MLGPNFFQVQSHAESHPRTVDMGRYQGNGQCDCPAFAVWIRLQVEDYLKQKRFKPGEFVPLERLMCKHIKAIHFWQSNIVVQNQIIQCPDANQPT